MRVVHLIERLDAYGTAEPLRSLAISQAARGIDVHVAALDADRRAVARLRSQGVQVLIADRRWPFDPLALLRLALWLRQPRDWLHAWGESAIAFAARLTKRSAGPRLASLSESAALSRRAVRRLASACSQFDAAAILGQAACPWTFDPLGNDAAPQPSLVRVPRTIQPWTSSLNGRSELLSAWGLPLDVRFVVTAGPLVRRRRLDDAIWNFALVRTLHERLVLVIVGDGPDRRRLERFAAQVGDPGSVVLVGYREDWRDLLAQAHAYWEVGPLKGALPQAACEALVAGVPVVVGRVGKLAVSAGIQSKFSGKPIWTEAVGRLGFAKHTDRLLSDGGILSETNRGTISYAVHPDDLLAATGRELCSHGDMTHWDRFYASTERSVPALDAS